MILDLTEQQAHVTVYALNLLIKTVGIMPSIQEVNTNDVKISLEVADMIVNAMPKKGQEVEVVETPVADKEELEKHNKK